MIDETDYGYKANQNKYVSSLTELTKDATFDEFRTTSHKLA